MSEAIERGVNPYAKWSGADWRLVSPVEWQRPDGCSDCDRKPANALCVVQ